MWLKNFCAITVATLCWLCCSLASASTPELTYIITETELAGLESRLLANANKSLQAFAQEEARTQRRIKRQRNTAIAVAVGLLAYKVFK